MFTIPNTSDAAYPGQADPDKVDIDILVAGVAGDGVVTGCVVTVQGVPDMTVAVAVGSVCISGVMVGVVAGNVAVAASHGTLPRFDLVTIDNAGVKSCITGVADSNPVFPQIPVNSVVIAAVYVPEASTVVGIGQITDKRVMVAAAIISRGVYSSGTTYAKNNWVTYGGSAWMSLVSGNLGNTPVEGVNWTRIASDGLTTNRIIVGPTTIPSVGQAITGTTYTDVTNLAVSPNTTSPIEIVVEGDVRLSTQNGWVAGTLLSLVRLISDRFRTVADGVTNSTTTLTSATMAFTSDDVGQPISGGSIPVGTTISSFTNSTTVIMSQAAAGSASGLTLTLGVVEIVAPRHYMAAWVTSTNPAFESAVCWVFRVTPPSTARTYRLQAQGGNVNGVITFIGSASSGGLGVRILARLP
jgi:hypothetical protein